MSLYTTELRFLIKSGYPLTALNNYPIYDEKFRPTLNSYIINHFYFREIGFETAEMFNFYLGATLNEIMPYYNQIFKAALKEIDPLSNYKYKENSNRKNTGTNGSENSNTSKNVYSKPADGTVQMSKIEENLYATSVTLTENNSKGTENVDMATDYIREISGVNGISEAEVFEKYRKCIVSVVQIFLKDKELNQCFMGVY